MKYITLKLLIIFSIFTFVYNYSTQAQNLKKHKCEDGYGFINTITNIQVIECKYDSVGNFQNGFAGVRIGNKWGFIDKTGKEICNIKYDAIGDFRKDGKAPIRIGDKRFYIDRTGKEI